MDPSPKFTVVGEAPVRAAGPGFGQLLLPAGPRVRREPLLSAFARRGIHSASFLRRAQNDGLAAITTLCGGAEASAAALTGDGFDGGVSQATFELQSTGPQALSLFAQRHGYRAAQSSLEHRHHLY